MSTSGENPRAARSSAEEVAAQAASREDTDRNNRLAQIASRTIAEIDQWLAQLEAERARTTQRRRKP